MSTNQPSDPKAPTTVFNFMNPVTPSTTVATSAPPQSWSTPTTTSNLMSGMNVAAFKTPTTTPTQNKPTLPTTGFSLTPNAQSPAVTNFSLQAASKPGGATTTAAVSQPSSVLTTSAPAVSITTAATATPSSAPTLGGTSLGAGVKPPAAPLPTQPQSLNFQQLEELILNKWTAELYEQEKVFYTRATQINIWDKVINENAEKLTQLHTTMEKVRKQQTKINDDLEVIATHQKDLEACLVPLEKEDLLSVLKGDPNRKNLYSNAKKIDSQIKSMSENLKETIEHINETSRSHDTEDPVIQVGRILNAHMESLRWIDEHTARMQDYFDSLLKIHDDLRRECDISKH